MEIDGTLVASQGKGQSVEVVASAVMVLGEVDDPATYPVAKKGHTFEYLRTVFHLRPRTNTFGALVKSAPPRPGHPWLLRRPGLPLGEHAADYGERLRGAGELFLVSTFDALNPPRTAEGQVDFKEDFGQEAFLTVSGQLQVESYSACRRSTPSAHLPRRELNTSRHLAEFWMVEPEIAFATLKENAELVEGLLKHAMKTVLRPGVTTWPSLEAASTRSSCRALSTLLNLLRAPQLHRSRKDLEASDEKFEFFVAWGQDRKGARTLPD